jgi:hypothetical protein
LGSAPFVPDYAEKSGIERVANAKVGLAVNSGSRQAKVTISEVLWADARSLR